MSVRRSVALGVGLALLAPLAAPGSAGAVTVDPEAHAASGALEWLTTQQQADGGFELAGFPGFETPDAVLAVAAVGRQSYVADPGPLAVGAWDQADALASVEALTENGKDALDAIDDLIDGAADPTTVAAGARAAKVAALVAEPLGIDPTDFDPSGDSVDPVDLLALADLHKLGDGSYDFGAQFSGALYTAIAHEGAGRPVPEGLVFEIRTAQRPDGSWDYTGSINGDGEDIDTTALALQALRSAGLTIDDAEVAAGVAFLAARQQASGAWQAFGADDPNSTAVAAVALSDLHIDVTTPAWRTAFGSPVSGAYTSPYTWLVLQQTSSTDGHIVSGNDGWGVTTFATTQGIQALARQWFLAAEEQALVAGWSTDLASPAASPSASAFPLTSASVPTNPSVKVQRAAGANAAVNGQKGREAAAADLFEQAFNRTIDPSGRAYWSNKLATISRPEVLARLTGSSEFYRKAGGTIPTFVDAVYQSVLGRAADPSGRAYWIGRLTNGTSVQAVARNLTASSEYRRKQVNTAFQRLLERAPSTGERDYWTTKIATTRIEVLLAALGASAEYYELASA